MKKKKKLPFIIKPMIIVFIALILICAFFYLYMKQKTAPDPIVEHYLDTFISKDENAIFNILGYKESSFLTPQKLLSSLEECHDFQSITSYALTKYEEPEQLTYKIEYWTDGRQNPYTQNLILKKSEEKLYLFFDQWDIDNSEFLARNCSVKVPANAKVYVDDIQVPVSKQEPENGLVPCVIGDLFTGTHTFTFEIDGFDKITKTIFLNNDDYSDKELFTIPYRIFSMTDETKNDLKKTAKQFIKGLYSNAFSNHSFDELTSNFMFEDSTIQTMEQEYLSFLTNHIASETHLTNVEFRSFDSSISSCFTEDYCYGVQVSTDVAYTADSLVFKDTDESSTGTERSTDSSSTFTTTFHYKNGIWYIYDTTVLDFCVYYIKY